jgi:hypothetical protein
MSVRRSVLSVKVAVIVLLGVPAIQPAFGSGCSDNCLFQYRECRSQGLSDNRCTATYQYCVQSCSAPPPESPAVCGGSTTLSYDDIEKAFTAGTDPQESDLQVGKTWGCTASSKAYDGGPGYYDSLYQTYVYPHWVPTTTCPASLTIQRQGEQFRLDVGGDTTYTHVSSDRQEWISDLDPVSNFDFGVNQVAFALEPGATGAIASAIFPNREDARYTIETNVELRRTAQGSLAIHYHGEVTSSGFENNVDEQAEGYVLCDPDR